MMIWWFLRAAVHAVVIYSYHVSAHMTEKERASEKKYIKPFRFIGLDILSDGRNFEISSLSIYVLALTCINVKLNWLEKVLRVLNFQAWGQEQCPISSSVSPVSESDRPWPTFNQTNFSWVHPKSLDHKSPEKSLWLLYCKPKIILLRSKSEV